MRDLKEKTPLLQRTYQITLRIYDYAGRFPRAQKPVIGNKILETANYILEKVMEVTYLQADEKKRALEEYDLNLKRLLLFLRLAKDLSFLSHKGYEYLCREITDMGRMAGGWQKWQIREKERRKGSVVYTTESPLIKRYLELKTLYPQQRLPDAYVFLLLQFLCCFGEQEK